MGTKLASIGDLRNMGLGVSDFVDTATYNKTGLCFSEYSLRNIILSSTGSNKVFTQNQDITSTRLINVDDIWLYGTLSVVSQSAYSVGQSGGTVTVTLSTTGRKTIYSASTTNSATISPGSGTSYAITVPANTTGSDREVVAGFRAADAKPVRVYVYISQTATASLSLSSYSATLNPTQTSTTVTAYYNGSGSVSGSKVSGTETYSISQSGSVFTMTIPQNAAASSREFKYKISGSYASDCYFTITQRAVSLSVNYSSSAAANGQTITAAVSYNGAATVSYISISGYNYPTVSSNYPIFAITIPYNGTNASRQFGVRIQDANGIGENCIITQAANTITITATPSTTSVNSGSTTVSVSVAYNGAGSVYYTSISGYNYPTVTKGSGWNYTLSIPYNGTNASRSFAVRFSADYASAVSDVVITQSAGVITVTATPSTSSVGSGATTVSVSVAYNGAGSVYYTNISGYNYPTVTKGSGWNYTLSIPYNGTNASRSFAVRFSADYASAVSDAVITQSAGVITLTASPNTTSVGNTGGTISVTTSYNGSGSVSAEIISGPSGSVISGSHPNWNITIPVNTTSSQVAWEFRFNATYATSVTVEITQAAGQGKCVTIYPANVSNVDMEANEQIQINCADSYWAIPLGEGLVPCTTTTPSVLNPGSGYFTECIGYNANIGGSMAFFRHTIKSGCSETPNRFGVTCYHLGDYYFTYGVLVDKYSDGQFAITKNTSDLQLVFYGNCEASLKNKYAAAPGNYDIFCCMIPQNIIQLYGSNITYYIFINSSQYVKGGGGGAPVGPGGGGADWYSGNPFETPFFDCKLGGGYIFPDPIG